MTLPSEFDSAQEILRKVIGLLSPLTEDQRKFVFVSAAAWFGDSDKLTTPPLKQDVDTGTPPSLQNFVFSKKTKKDTEAVAVLGYYLAVYRGQELFKTTDIDALNKEAATGQIFGNVTKTVNNAAQRSRFFASVGEKGFKKITPLGRMVVEALPDEEEVKKIVQDHKPRPKKRKAKKQDSG